MKMFLILPSFAKTIFQTRNIIFHSAKLSLKLNSMNSHSNFTHQLHQSSTQSKRFFQDHENQHAHGIVLSRANYVYPIDYKTQELSESEFKLFCDETNWASKSDEELVDSFKRLAVYCELQNINLSDARFDLIVDALCYRCFKFTDQHLENVLKYLGAFPETVTINDRNFVELWSALDDTCVERVTEWKTDKMLEIADLWYRLRLSKLIKFTFSMLRKIERRAKKLTPMELVQTMFHINLFRKRVIDMMKFEINFAESIDHLSIDEIGIVGMGFFKTQTKFVNLSLVTNIYKRTIAELKTISDITLVSILKNLRYSSHFEHTDIMYALLEAITPQISRLSLLSCLHIGLLGSDLQLYHQKSLESIVNKFLTVCSTARLKDMERMAFIIGLFDLKMDSNTQLELCKNILDEIPKRINEIMRHPRCLAACMHYLSLSGFSSNEIISNVLDPKFIEATYGKNMILCRDIFHLDAYTRINLRSSYEGNQLTLKQRKILAGIFQNSQIKYRKSATTRLSENITQKSKEVYNTTMSLFLLPHFERNDILLAFDRDSKSTISLSHLSSKIESHYGEILDAEFFLSEIDYTNVMLVPIVVGGWNNFIRGQDDRPTGLFKMKLDQLRLIGFNPIIISWFEWNSLSDDKKCKLLENKVNSIL